MQVYAIPWRDHFIIYRPLTGLAFVANAALAHYLQQRVQDQPAESQPELEAFLEGIGFWRPDPSPLCPAPGDDKFAPTQAVLMLTGACNLRCGYCYARGGEKAHLRLDPALALGVVQEAQGHAARRGEPLTLVLHGGGEPTLAWDLLTRVVEHAKSLDPDCRVALASNGLWSPAQRDYLIQNLDQLSLSFDGIQAVQDAQRPLAGGGGSFAPVLANLKELDRAGKPYGLRMTVLPEFFHTLPQSLEFIARELKPRAVQVEPCFSTRQGPRSGPREQQVQEFGQAFLAAHDLAAEAGLSLRYSGARPGVVTGCFCQAPQKALMVTPQGDLVACFEVTDRSHVAFERFWLGRASARGIQVDQDRLAAFQKEQAERREQCAGCFCYWHCAGDCSSRALAKGQENQARCQLNQMITRELLLRQINGGKKERESQ